MPATDTAINLANTAARAASDRLGFDIVALDVSGQLVITDAFVIVSARSDRQVNAVVDAVEEALLKEHGVTVLRREGKGESAWVLLDFGDIIVHVFAEEDRQFYGLEKLWKDCPVIDVSGATSPSGSASAGDDQVAGDADPLGGAEQ